MMTVCAVYTRKSTEDRLDMQFNSLEAQADACRAYIDSQKHAGWHCLEEEFIDPGISGGTLNRPALQRLLHKIQNREIGVVVVHKVDRLTRSLSDFAKLADLFENHGVSFVSVTQHLDTSTSMGRLSLNVLLSFAQFEREIASERIKEKIHASRKRGLWTGGRVPLGYQARDKKLVIDQRTAPLVRSIFEEYLRLRSVTDLRLAWEAGQLQPKTEVGRRSTAAVGAPSRGALCTILRNPVYVGKLRCGDKLVDGLHTGIVPPDIWNAVQETLGAAVKFKGKRSKCSTPSALVGKLFECSGRRLTRSHTRKADGKRYSYYVSSGSTRNRREKASLRIPCQTLEKLIVERILTEIRSPESRMALGEQAGLSSDLVCRLASWQEAKEAPQGDDFILSVVQRVDIADGSASIACDFESLLSHFLGSNGAGVVKEGPRKVLKIEHSALVSRVRGSKCRIIRERQSKEQVREDGRRWFTLLVTGKAKDMYEIAEMHGVSQATVSRTIAKELAL